MTDKPEVLDSVIHKALREMAQGIADEHGIQITDVYLRWADTRGSPAGRVLEIEVKTRTT